MGKLFYLIRFWMGPPARLVTKVEKIYVHKVVHQLVKSFPVS